MDLFQVKSEIREYIDASSGFNAIKHSSIFMLNTTEFFKMNLYGGRISDIYTRDKDVHLYYFNQLIFDFPKSYVLRYFKNGDVLKEHSFVHEKVYYDYANDELVFLNNSFYSIFNKELVYKGEGDIPSLLRFDFTIVNNQDMTLSKTDAFTICRHISESNVDADYIASNIASAFMFNVRKLTHLKMMYDGIMESSSYKINSNIVKTANLDNSQIEHFLNTNARLLVLRHHNQKVETEIDNNTSFEEMLILSSFPVSETEALKLMKAVERITTSRRDTASEIIASNLIIHSGFMNFLRQYISTESKLNLLLAMNEKFSDDFKLTVSDAMFEIFYGHSL